MILEGSLANSHILALSKPLELLVENLGVPYLIGIVDDSDLRSVGIQFEHLQYFNLKIKVVKLLILLNISERLQRCDKLV